jgi:hypothetical protein
MRSFVIAFAILLLSSDPCIADGPAIADPLVEIPQENDDRTVGNGGVIPASYAVTPVPLPAAVNVLPAAGGASPTSATTPAFIDQEVNWGAPVVSPCCDCDAVFRTNAWRFSTEFIATQSNVTVGQFGEWPDEGALGIRFIFGYETESGLGIRGRLWGFGQDVETPADQVDLSASTFSVDIYKRLFIEDTEVVLGAGPAGSGLGFQLSNESESRFVGGGLTAFAEVWQPLWQFTKFDLGFAGRGRLSLLAGNWRDDTGFVIAATNDDRMNVLEFAWGLELRRRFGACQDMYWFLLVLAEHQHWHSAWMTDFAHTSVGFAGTNITFGLAL